MKMEVGHLLVADDNEMNRDILSRRLTRKGHTVAVAEDGRRALEMIEGQEFDLVLLDIMMPGIDGLEVLKRLRQTYSVADLPIIMVTAKDQSQDIVEALKLGANDYVTKPLDFAVVLARVQTQLSLKRLAELKDEFLRIASHDLKHPLTSIMGTASLLVAQVPPGATMPKEMHALALRMQSIALVMQRIIEDFLDFQAMEDGHLHLEREATDLNEIARNVVESTATHAERKGIEVTSEFEPELPQIDADRTRIAQVVQNFVSNAIKFAPSGSTAVIRTLVNGQAVVLEVSDSGPGLTDKDMKKAFVKYARLSSKPTGGEKSSGLGLAICKQLIDLHGGKIGVRNNPKSGATFWFKLPIA